jgi:formate/nitrite transporter FocA (FNT family)
MALDFGQTAKKKAKQTSDGAPGNPSPISTRTEQKQVEERLAIGAHVVYETIRREGEEELNRPAAALAWSGLAAGLSMGFSFIAETLLMAHLPDSPWRLLVSRAGYSIGFLIVILGRQQLFTENTLTVILPLLARKDAATLLRVLRLWGIVLSANLVGTFLLVGKGTLKPQNVITILEAKNRSAAGATAPASGLYLVSVEYANP